MRLSNNTKIKYLKVHDKIYEITDMMVGDAPDDEIWNIEDLKNYKINLINNSGQAEIVDFEK